MDASGDGLRHEIADDIGALLAGAADDPERLRRLADYISGHRERAAAGRAAREGIAARMRDAGVAMTDIARDAQVDDSYLSRALLKMGMTPRVRRPRREDAPRQ